MKDVIKKEQLLKQPIQKVWDAISKGEELSMWFIQADFKAVKGYQYTFKAGEEQGCTEITGEVKEANPYTLVYTWIVQNTTAETTVKWVLEEVQEGTKLYLEHSGISNYPNEETAITMMGHFDKGWDNCINMLSEYLIKQVHAG